MDDWVTQLFSDFLTKMASWSVEERNREAHLRWKNLTGEEKEVWNRKADSINKTKPSDLPVETRKKMVEASLKRLANEVS